MKDKGLVQITAESLVTALAVGYVLIVLMAAPLFAGKYLGHGLGLTTAIVNIILYIYYVVYKAMKFRAIVFGIAGLIMLIVFADLAHKLDVEKNHDLWKKLGTPTLVPGEPKK